MDKMYVRLLELGEEDSFHTSHNGLTDYSQLIGRVFAMEWNDGHSPWLGFKGKLVGETLGDWDDGYYIFAYAKVEEVSNPTLI